MIKWLANAIKCLTNIRHPLFMCIVIVLAIYPISLFIHIPKWDSVIAYLPYRYFISDYVWSGQLPLWSPFQRLGYPGYSDLQSGFWYPVFWLILIGGKYTMTSLMVELTLTFLIAGIGMYKLVLRQSGCKTTSMVLGMTYALSGFMLGSAQLMVFLIGMAWLPWCIRALLNWLSKPGIREALWLAFFVSMNLTGASPAFTIVLIYLFAGVMIFHIKQYSALRKRLSTLIRTGFIAGLWLILFLLPFWIAFADFAPYFNRTGKLPFEAVILNPFVFADYISFILPFAVLTNSEWFAQTDLSLRDAYVGLLVLVAFAISVFRFSALSTSSKWTLVAVMLALVLALGDHSPVFGWVYHLPGFGLFRHPSFFRGYAIFGMLLVSAPLIKNWLKAEAPSVLLKRAWIAAFMAVLALAIWGWWASGNEEIRMTIRELWNRTEFSSTGALDHIVINALITLVALSLCALLVQIKVVNARKAIVGFVSVDLIIHAFLTAPTTLHYPVRYAEVRPFFRQLPQSHNQEFNQTPFKYLNDNSNLASAPGLYLNLATFNRALSATGENPMRFRAFDAARDTEVLEFNLENPLFWTPVIHRDSADTLQPGVIWEVPFTLCLDGNLKISNPLTGYNTFEVEIENVGSCTQWLVLNQNYHHLWRAELNGQFLPIQRVNELVMAVEIPPEAAGKVRWSYHSPWLVRSIGLSLVAGLCFLFIVLRRRE